MVVFEAGCGFGVFVAQEAQAAIPGPKRRLARFGQVDVMDYFPYFSLKALGQFVQDIGCLTSTLLVLRK